MQKLCTACNEHWLHSNRSENQLFKCEGTVNVRYMVTNIVRMATPLASTVTWSIGKNGVVVNILTHDSELVDGFEGKGSYVQNDLYLGQEWAVSRKYLSFPLSLHIASSLSNTIVKVVCFSVLTTQQQAGGYHVTAFSCCIRVEPLQLISKSAHAGLHPQTYVYEKLI